MYVSPELLHVCHGFHSFLNDNGAICLCETLAIQTILFLHYKLIDNIVIFGLVMG